MKPLVVFRFEVHAARRPAINADPWYRLEEWRASREVRVAVARRCDPPYALNVAACSVVARAGELDDGHSSRRGRPSRNAEEGRMPGKARGTKRSAGTTVTAYANVWKGCRLPTREQINSLERESGAALPEPLRDLFEAIAGGRPTKNFCRYPGSQEGVLIGMALPLEQRRHEPGAVEVLRILRSVHGVGRSLIPFAADFGYANYICVDSANGDVLYWLHDDSINPLRLLSHDLTAFISGLEESPY